jgi:hypothetical protein
MPKRVSPGCLTYNHSRRGMTPNANGVQAKRSPVVVCLECESLSRGQATTTAPLSAPTAVYPRELS